MTRIVRSPAAKRDLDDIWRTIVREHPSAARRIVRKIGTRIEQLKDHLRLGPRRPDIGPSVRMLVAAPYLILFDVHPDTDEGPVNIVDIVRIVDGRRDLTTLF